MNGRQLIKKRNEKREREKYEFFVKFYSDLEKANNGRKLERYDNHWYIDYNEENIKMIEEYLLSWILNKEGRNSSCKLLVDS